MPETLVVELNRLAERPLTRSQVLDVDAHPWVDAGLEFSRPPRVSFRARATTTGGVQVDGELDVTIRLACRRCLEENAVDFAVPFNFILEPGLEPGAEDEGVFPLRPDHERVDLAPMVREELLLAVPEFPVCREDCRGLCPRCGTDLNQSKCECLSTDADPRWEALRKLRA